MKIRSRLSKNLSFLVCVFIIGSGLVLGFNLISKQFSAQAFSARDFNPGRIIDDAVFYNKDAMNAQQIQTFLNTIIPWCNTWNSQSFVDAGGNRVSAPYVCLNNYHENPTTGETSFEKGGGAFPGGVSAAQIIYNAAQKYGINPQVLLVMLKKESLGPLTSDNWPTKWQYRYSMGYDCSDSGPDFTAACNEKQAGFYKQMELAAWQLKYYKDHPNDYRYKIGWNDIQYSPDISCGTKRVYIENIATLSLYIYTPYVPNDGAIADYPGTSHCGAYGNRNFYMFFREWFGNTYRDLNFAPLEDPRWMKTNKTLYKIDITTGNRMTDNQLNAGRQIKFEDKILLNGRWLLRTSHDKSAGNLQGIPQDELSEIEFENLDSPKWMTLQKDGNKSIPKSRGYKEPLQAGTTMKMVQKIIVDNTTYYRSEYDKNAGNHLGVIDRQLSEDNFIELHIPTIMTAHKDTPVINPFTNKHSGQISQGQTTQYSHKTLINGIWYFQPSEEASTKSQKTINSQDLSRPEINKFSQDITIELPSTIYKYDLHKIAPTRIGPFTKGLSIRIYGSVEVNDKLYFMTSHDFNEGNNQGFLVDDLFIDLQNIQQMTTKASIYKLGLKHFEDIDHLLNSDQKIRFSQKIYLDGKWYYRTEFDKNNNNLLCVSSDKLM